MKRKEKDSIKLESLRAIKSAIILFETKDSSSNELNESDEIKILQRLVKQRKESAERSISLEKRRKESAEKVRSAEKEKSAGDENIIFLCKVYKTRFNSQTLPEGRPTSSVEGDCFAPLQTSTGQSDSQDARHHSRHS